MTLIPQKKWKSINPLYDVMITSHRVPTEITPAMDSGDESEVAELTATKSVGKTNAPKALAREHPFSPMVNR